MKQIVLSLLVVVFGDTGFYFDGGFRDRTEAIETWCRISVEFYSLNYPLCEALQIPVPDELTEH